MSQQRPARKLPSLLVDPAEETVRRRCRDPINVEGLLVAKVLALQLHLQPSNEYSGLISFGMDWLDLLAVQGTLKSLLQHHSSGDV